MCPQLSALAWGLAAVLVASCAQHSPETGGYVIVGFDINSKGRVHHVIVLASHPDARFDETARDTVEKWSYDPDEIEVPKYGVKVRLDFREDGD